MADSLTLIGAKSVKKHTGSEMSPTLTKRGSAIFSLKQWWTGGKSTTYVKCAVLTVKISNHICKLAVPVSDESSIRIDHDGNFNFQFFNVRGVKRVALFDRDFNIIEHYVMPSESGGQVMTVTPLGAEKKPTLVVAQPEVKKAPELPKKRKSPSRLKIDFP